MEEEGLQKKMAETHIARSTLLRKDFLAVLVMVANAFSWFFPLYLFFQSTLEKFLTDFMMFSAVLGVHFVGAIGFAFAGTWLVRKSSRSSFLCAWMLIGVIASAMMFLLEVGNLMLLVLVSFLLGISLGMGFPSGLAYFGDYSVEKNRGSLGGITFFASGLSILLVGLLVNSFDFTMSVLILIAWRGLGLVLFLLIRPRQEQKKDVEVPYQSILFNRSLVLYLVPWIMFCLVNFLEHPIITNFFGADLALLMPIAEYGIGGFSALIGGWFADSVGRKRIVIFGFIILGIGFAILGLLSSIVLLWYLYIILDGIAWGIFSLMFYLVIWADLAGNRSKEKYYLIGVLPFFVGSYIEVLFAPYAQTIPISVAFSLASLFLFLAVLPLLYAPETLSEKEIEKKRLQKYLEDVKKVRKKYKKE